MTTGEVIALIKAFGGSGGGSSGGGVLVVHEDENGTLDKTWQEIHDADVVMVAVDNGTEKTITMLLFAIAEGGTYSVVFSSPAINSSMIMYEPLVYTASSASGYPSYTE